MCRPVYSFVRKIVTLLQIHTFLKRPFLTDVGKHTHLPPPPPRERYFGALNQKLRKSENCEFAPCWHLMDVPKRYLYRQGITTLVACLQRWNNKWYDGVFYF